MKKLSRYTLILFLTIFTTLSCSKSQPEKIAVIDLDGNKYHSVQIGTQTWLVENLKTTKYRNGENIPNLQNLSAWTTTSEGAYCDYNNETKNGETYGRLYNWHAVNDIRKIAPEGWHVATDAEWQTLIDYLGGWQIAAGKLKETGFAHWNQPNYEATNESKFTAIGSGLRFPSNGNYLYLKEYGYFWSPSASGLGPIFYKISYFTNYIEILDNQFTKETGLSIRCVKD